MVTMEWEMSWVIPRVSGLRLALALAAGGLALSGCATQGYVDEQIAAVNTRISSVEARAQDAAQRADAANSAAQAAANDARTANQRLDQLTGRVDQMEQAAARRPRN
jgi:outer membrane murein-binding lipoprotein Lpp